MKETKKGRPRQYGFTAVSEAADKDIGFAIATLDELSERVFDQISDLPQDALDFLPEGSYLSIKKLVLHLGWAEGQWLERASGKPVPDDLRDLLGQGTRENLINPVSSSLSASGLIDACRRIRKEYTIPILSEIEDIDQPFENKVGPKTIRQGLMHLIWHWIYHSGHIGLTRLLWGSDYDWRFA